MAFTPACCEHGADLPTKLINGHRLLGEQRHLDALGCTAKSSRGNKLAKPSKIWDVGLRQIWPTRSTLTVVARFSPLASLPMATARVRSGVQALDEALSDILLPARRRALLQPALCGDD